MELEKLIKERRSAKNFIESEKISKKELDDIFELVRYVPSCYNLQHTRYIVVADASKQGVRGYRKVVNEFVEYV